MIWIFILAALAFVLGGVLAVRPSKAQQKVAQIREAAIQSGIHVKLPVSLRFPEGIEKGRRPYYCKHLKDKALSASFYCAFRDDARIRTSQGNLSPSQKRLIDNILVSSAPAIDSFYLGEGLIGFSWHESEDPKVLDELCANIDKVQTLLCA